MVRLVRRVGIPRRPGDGNEFTRPKGRVRNLKPIAYKDLPDTMKGLRKQPAKNVITTYTYRSRVLHMIPHIDEVFYRHNLSGESLRRYCDIVDAEWQKDRDTIDRIIARGRKVQTVTKSKYGYRRCKRIGLQSRPSLRFANQILNRLLSASVSNLNATTTKTFFKDSDSRMTYIKYAAKSSLYYNKYVWDYHSIWGLTQPLITSLLKAKNYGFLLYLWEIEPHSNFISKVQIGRIDRETYDELNELGIDLSSDIKYNIKFGDSDAIVQNGYSQAELVRHLRHNDSDDLLGKLIANGCLSSDKKSIDEYIRKCELKILAAIVRSGRKLSQFQIRKLFAYTEPKKRHIRYYYWCPYNQKLKGKHTEVCELFKALIEQNNSIPYSKAIQNYLYRADSKTALEMVYLLLDSKYIPNYPYNKHLDKLVNGHWKGTVHSIIAEDRIYDLMKMIDLNLINMSDLHNDPKFLAGAIVSNSRKCAIYMARDLRIKMCDYTVNTIWGWRGLANHPENKIQECLDLMVDLGIPIRNDVFESAVRRKKVKTMEYLMKNHNFELKTSHLRYIKKYDVANFNKYTKMLGVDKARLVVSMARGTKPDARSWRRRDEKEALTKRNKVILNIIASQPSEEKKKLAMRVGISALSNYNTALYSTLQTRYRFDIAIQDIKRIINNKNYSCGDHKWIMTIKKRSPTIYAELANLTNDEKVRMLTKGISRDDSGEDIETIMNDIDVEADLALIQKVYEALLRTDHWWGDRTELTASGVRTIVKLLRTTAEYKNHTTNTDTADSANANAFARYAKYVMSKSGYMVLQQLRTKSFNPYSFLDIKNVYESVMTAITQEHRIPLGLITKCGLELTPAIWSVIRYASEYVIAEDRWWARRIKMTRAQIDNILQLESRMTQEDYDYYFKDLKVPKRKAAYTEPRIIVYDIEDDEKPSNYDFYVGAYVANLTRIERKEGANEMELALEQAEKELLEEGLQNDDGEGMTIQGEGEQRVRVYNPELAVIGANDANPDVIQDLVIPQLL